MLRAIFGEKAGDVRDASLICPPGIEGIVVDVKIFSRKGMDKDERSKSIESDDVLKLQRDHQDERRIIDEEKNKKIRKLLLGKIVGRDLMDPESGDVVLKKKGKLTAEILKKLSDENIRHIILSDPDEQKQLEEIERRAKEQGELLQTLYDEKVGRLKRGDELPPGVIKLVKVYIAMKRKVSVGDKMAGRHGNKGVVSRILPEEDMPYLPDGTPVQIVLNPLGVPSRMNVGQILETHLGWAARALGLHVSSPVFDGASEKEIKELLKKAKLPPSGQSALFDGRTGEPFGSMGDLMAVAEIVDKLQAICVVCGDPACRNQRLIDGRPAPFGSPTIMVGGSESYEARCRHCHAVPRIDAAQVRLL